MPLRSDERPLGLPGLQNLDAIRVAATNRLYALALLVLCIPHLRGASLRIENPSNSHFWSIIVFFASQHGWMKQILEQLETNSFQACMYGSKRNKWTSFKSTPTLYTAICKECDGTHEHESWRPRASGSSVVFPTSLEAEYPIELCRAMVSCLGTWLVQRGAKFPSQLVTNDTKMSARQVRQFGKKQLPPLLSEYCLVADYDIAALFPKAKLLSACPPGLKMGDDSVVQHAELNNSFAVALEDQYAILPGTVLRACGKNDDPGKKWYGVHRTHLQAIQAALHLRHPMDMQVPTPDILIRAIFNVLTMGEQKFWR